LLALPPSAAIDSYWSPHTPDVPGVFEGTIEEAVVEEPEEVLMKETEYLKADNNTHPQLRLRPTATQLGLHPYHIATLHLLPPTKFARIPMWPPAPVSPAR